MKTRNLILVLVMFLLTQCKDTTVTSTINSNGSIDRKVVRKTNKRTEDNFIVPVDSTWEITNTKELDTNNKKTDSLNTTSYDTIFCTTATKHYKNVEELNEDYQNVKSSFKGERSATFDKHFRWFYTTYEYTEKIGKLTDEYPLEKEFSSKELEFIYLTEEQKNDSIKSDSLKYHQFFEDLKQKQEIWQNKCFVSILKKDLRKLLTHDYKVDPKTTNEIVKNLDTIPLDGLSDDEMFKNLIPDSLNLNKDTLISKLGRGNLQAVFNNEYDMIFKMPGKLIETNGLINENGEAQWFNISPDRYLSNDFVMKVKSRKPNYRMWVLSVVIIISAFTFFRKK